MRFFSPVLVLVLLTATATATTTPPPPADVAAPPPDAQKTPSGLATRVVVRGTGKQHPGRNDCVRIRFVAWNRKGELSGTSSNDDEGEVQCLHRMAPGIAEAVAPMVAGETRRLWIPLSLIYPPDDDDPPPPLAADLTYDFTLLAIIAAPPPPRALKAPPSRARKLPSGVAIELLRRAKDKNSPHPAEGQQIALHFSGWKADGTLFQSTTMAGGTPAEFTLRELVPGLREAVQQMTVGQRARIWVPAALAYGEKPHRRAQPAGDLVYEVEVIGVR